MKLTDYLIIFVLILIPFSVVSNLKTKDLQLIEYKKLTMDRMLETAAEDAASQMVERGEDKKVVINKEKAVQFLFNSIYVNMRIMDDEIKQKEITGYIPVIAVMDYTGYYIMSNEIYTAADGSKRIDLIWHPKKMYSVSKDHYIISFALDLNFVGIYDTTTKTLTEGAYDNIKAGFPEQYIQDKDIFEQMRRNAIIDTLQADFNECINRQNDIAKHFGIAYNFTLPNIERDDWTRSINDYGVIAFFQGMPIGTGEYYNNFALGGARIFKKAKLYIQIDAATGLKYYHRASCPTLNSKKFESDDASEAAREGALPCPVCKP